MFTHVMVGANDIEASKTFYDPILGTLGCKPGILSINTTNQKRYIYIHEKNMFIISEPINGEPASIGNGSTIGFSVPDVELAIMSTVLIMVESRVRVLQE